MNERERKINHKKLLRLIQQIRAKELAKMEEDEREVAKLYLTELDKKYTNDTINIDEYKFLALTFLMKNWSVNEREQFLYRNAGNFLTQAEKFAISEFFPQKLQD